MFSLVSSAQFIDYTNSRLYHSDWLLFDTPADADLSSVDASQLAAVTTGNANGAGDRQQVAVKSHSNLASSGKQQKSHRGSSTPVAAAAQYSASDSSSDSDHSDTGNSQILSATNVGPQPAMVPTIGLARPGSLSNQQSYSHSSSGRQAKAAPGYQAAAAAVLDTAPDGPVDSSDNSDDGSASDSNAQGSAQGSYISSQQSGSKTGASSSSHSNSAHQISSNKYYGPGAGAVKSAKKSSQSSSSSGGQPAQVRNNRKDGKLLQID